MLTDAVLTGAMLTGISVGCPIPVVDQIDASILAAIQSGGALDMTRWHTCETTHCQAGWAIVLAGDAGRELERRYGSGVAGALIYAASRPGQPVPNFFSPYFHFMPLWFEKLSVLFNHWVELICPWLIFVPGWGLLIAGLSMTFFQIVLILSGNLAFLNWLTLVPVLACFKDPNWRRVLPGFLTRAAEWAEQRKERSAVSLYGVIGLVILVGFLSFKPVENLLSPEQAMNTSFEPYDLVNTYGAFGSVGRERLQLAIEGTMDKVPNEKADWKEYGFKVQPGQLDRHPPWISPYHYRLDWLAWFAAMASPAQYPWMFHLAVAA